MRVHQPSLAVTRTQHKSRAGCWNQHLAIIDRGLDLRANRGGAVAYTHFGARVARPGSEAQSNLVRRVRKGFRFGSQDQLSGSNWITKKNGDLAEPLYLVGVPDGI